jgi:hypothetical protein
VGTRTYTVPFTAPGTAELPAGRMFFIKEASAVLAIEADAPGAPTRFENVGAGLKYRAEYDKRWRTLRITSAVVQTVELLISDESDVDFANTVNVAGSVITTEELATAGDTPARISVPAAQTLLVAAAPSRRRVILQAPTTNTESVNVGMIGQVSAVRGFELAPGQWREWLVNYALYGFAVSGNQDIQIEEQS